MQNSSKLSNVAVQAMLLKMHAIIPALQHRSTALCLLDFWHSHPSKIFVIIYNPSHVFSRFLKSTLIHLLIYFIQLFVAMEV